MPTLFQRFNKEWPSDLQKENRGDTNVKAIKLQQALRRDFKSMKMKNVELLMDYFSREMEIDW